MYILYINFFKNFINFYLKMCLYLLPFLCQTLLQYKFKTYEKHAYIVYIRKYIIDMVILASQRILMEVA